MSSCVPCLKKHASVIYLNGQTNFTIITQGSVATVLRWGGRNCKGLRQVPSRNCIPEII